METHICKCPPRIAKFSVENKQEFQQEIMIQCNTVCVMSQETPGRPPIQYKDVILPV